MNNEVNQNMNPEAREFLNAILIKEEHELNQTEKEFLRARKSYLGKNSRNKFANTLKEENVATTAEPIEEEEDRTNLEHTDTSNHPADETAEDDNDGEDE